jgi:tRNA/rRNA methyltransferase
MKPCKVDWRVVLVRPRNPLNIGAAARALANFGLRKMVVVDPFPPTWEEARTAAVGAGPVLRSARVTPTLREAIQDAQVVIGTTSGSRRHLDRDLLPLPELAGWLQGRKHGRRAALLFGSEKTGLSNEDLSMCHALVRIPTAADCPSMNLGQAVAVCAYELARAGLVAARLPRHAAHASEPAAFQALEHVFERATRVLDVSGYLQPKSRAATLIKLRRLLLGLELTHHEVRILGGVLAQVEWKLAKGVRQICESQVGRARRFSQ